MSKVSFSIQYAGLQLQVSKNEQGQDVTPLKPIADLFGLRWSRQLQKVTNKGFLSAHLGACTLQLWCAGNQKREQICIRVDRVIYFLMNISPDQVRTHGNITGAEFLEQKLTEWSDALHDYEEMGEAINLNHLKGQDALRKSRDAFARMITVQNKTPGMPARRALSHLIKQMADELNVPFQIDLVDSPQEKNDE